MNLPDIQDWIKLFLSDNFHAFILSQILPCIAIATAILLTRPKNKFLTWYMIAKDMIVILQCLIGGTDENDRIDHCLTGTKWGDADLPKIIDDN